jgi:hypothetical protein
MLKDREHEFEERGILSTIYTVKHTGTMLEGHSVDVSVILNILNTVMSVSFQSYTRKAIV